MTSAKSAQVTASQENGLTSFKIKNFKGVGEWQEVPLKPITLVFGKNSAGKSTILHALAYIHDLLFHGIVNQILPSKGKGFINLGGLRQIIHFNSKGEQEKELGFSFCFSFDKKDLNKKIVNFLEEIEKALKTSLKTTKDTINKEKVAKRIEAVKACAENSEKILNHVLESNGKEPHIKYEIRLVINCDEFLKTESKFNQFDRKPEVSILIDGKLIITFDSNKKDTTKKTDLLKVEGTKEYSNRIENLLSQLGEMSQCVFLDEEFFKKISESYIAPIFCQDLVGDKRSAKLFKDIKPVLEQIGSAILFASLRLTPNRTRIFPFQPNPIYKMNGLQEITKNASSAEFDKLFLSICTALFSEILCHLGETARDYLHGFLRGIRYLEGIRYSPDRFINQYNLLKEKNVEGKSSLLSYNDLFKNKEVFQKTNEALSHLGADFTIEIEKGNKDLGDSLLIKKSNRRLSFKDIGFGWSQVVPVLVEAYAEDNSILCCEQPELHLHPSAQSELMSILACKRDKAKSPRLLLEAHSEQMIIRLLRLIRDKRINRDDCAILYVLPSKNGSDESNNVEFNLIRPDIDGRIGEQWPEDFFESGMRDLL